MIPPQRIAHETSNIIGDALRYQRAMLAGDHTLATIILNSMISNLNERRLDIVDIQEESE